MGFNLRKIQTLDTFEYEVLDQQGFGTGVVFTLASPTHPVRKAMLAEQQRKLIEKMAQRGRSRAQSTEMEESERDRAKQLTTCTLGWTGFEDESGNPVPFSKEAASSLYSDPTMHWLGQQVDAALVDDKLFTKGPSAT